MGPIQPDAGTETTTKTKDKDGNGLSKSLNSEKKPVPFVFFVLFVARLRSAGSPHNHVFRK
jgi:hypothetical protein